MRDIHVVLKQHSMPRARDSVARTTTARNPPARVPVKVTLFVADRAATLALPPRLRTTIIEASEDGVVEALRELLFLASEGNRDA